VLLLPLPAWVGHSCPTPLTLTLILTLTSIDPEGKGTAAAAAESLETADLGKTSPLRERHFQVAPSVSTLMVRCSPARNVPDVVIVYLRSGGSSLS